MARITPGGLLFGSCASGYQRPRLFNVGSGSAVMVSASGLGDEEVPILKWVGTTDGKIGKWEPAETLDGRPLVLSAETTQQLVSIPGRYTIDPAALTLDTEPCVCISAETVNQCELELLLTAQELEPECPELVPTGMVENDTGNCWPVFLSPNPDCTFDFVYFTPENKEPIMAVDIQPPGADSKTCKRADTLPFLIEGPAAAADYATILADALAANPTDFDFDGTAVPAAATDEVLAVSISRVIGDSFLLNGVVAGGVNDGDGVNMANELEVPDGCSVQVTFCLQKCLSKAEIAAL